MNRLIVVVLSLGALTYGQLGAKAMFYDPAGLGTSVGSSAVVSGLRQVLWSRPFPPYGYVGIHYWFETSNHRAIGEAVAATLSEPLTLHIRGNTAAYLEVWSTEGSGTELTLHRGYSMGVEPFVVPGTVHFVPGEQATRLIVVFARSQTEMATSPEHARRRLSDLGGRLGNDGRLLIVRESDEETPGEIGTYVVNRGGMPIATEIVLRSRGLPGLIGSRAAILPH